MKPLALISAAVGGIVGALIWAAISYFTGYEVGYVAWAIGGLVGFASLLAGGQGVPAGVLCAVIALLSILGGKGLAVQFQVEQELRELHAELLMDAKDFAKISSEDEYPAFMVSHAYTNATKATEVPQEDLDFFVQERIPILRELGENEPSYAEWRETERGKAFIDSVYGELSIVDMVKEDLGAIDLIFGLLGIVTAFKVGAAGRKDESEMVEEASGSQNEGQ